MEVGKNGLAAEKAHGKDLGIKGWEGVIYCCVIDAKTTFPTVVSPVSCPVPGTLKTLNSYLLNNK